MSASREVAHITFAEFQEDPRSAFAKAPGLTEQQTWEEVRFHVGEVAALATAQALAKVPVSSQMLDDWHRRIFESTFSAAAGRRRAGREPVFYTYVVSVDPDGELQTSGASGTGAGSLTRRLRKLCEQLNTTAERFDAARDDTKREQLPALHDVTYAAARFYAKFLSAHPYPDGNGRTAYVALQYALVRLGATGVELADYAEQQIALGQALRTDSRQSYLGFADLLERKIRAAAKRAL